VAVFPVVARASHSVGQVSRTGTASWNYHMNSANVFYSKLVKQWGWSRMNVGGSDKLAGFSVSLGHHEM
jgi:hypothetical protein